MKKILIVDDSKFMRNALKNIINKAGYEVIAEAEDGISAIELYEETNPDLITLDITMPKLNGIDALKKIRDFDNKVKIIMCSSMGQSYYIDEAIHSGADDFLIKPFKADKVLEIIKRSLEE